MPNLGCHIGNTCVHELHICLANVVKRKKHREYIMYLKEVVLDGFKSYATRTAVTGFDPLFNAITGLNGSGKSNVLDSICFVLGITNLSQVRASSLQELVYKGGQAGVTKATVTLVFDNSDKKVSPVGYEKCSEIIVTRQVVIGGRNKYLVNGHVAQPTKVQNLFHSVGLNVNNPHFLIMQGRITKVINMKPREIMSMVEEAAGTRMYENKKDAALKTIEKKERKVVEINDLLEKKINPSLEKLKGERFHYMEWAANKNDCDRLAKFIVAFRYVNAEKVIESSGDKIEELGGKVKELKDVVKERGREKKALEREVEELLENQDTEQSNRLSRLEGSVSKLEKDLVKEQSRWENQTKAVAAEKEALKEVKMKIETSTKELGERQVELENAESKIEQVQEAKDKSVKELQAAETALLTGAGSQSSDGVATGSLVEQLEAARRAASSATTDIKRLEMELAHSQKYYKEKRAALKSHRKEVDALKVKIRQSENAVSQAKIALHELDFNGDEIERLSDQLTKETKAASELKYQIDDLSARLAKFDFQYSDPERNFDRRRVKGKVAKLIRVKTSSMSTAIEVTAGGRLYQVVVDSESTGKALLKHGKLPGRVTILPLNKIARKRLPQDKLRAARQIEPQTALAIDLIDFNSEVASVMEYIFGQTLVSPDMDSAKTITFNKSILTRTVTPAGDVFDPSGTLSGGSNSRSAASSALTQLTKLNELESSLEHHNRNIGKLTATLQGLEEKAEKYRQLQSTLEFKQHDLDLLRKHLDESPTGRLLNEVTLLETQINKSIPEAIAKAKEAFETANAKVVRLEGSLGDEESARSQAEADAQRSKALIQERHENAVQALQAACDAKEKIAADLEALQEDLTKLQADCERLKTSVQDLEEEANNREASVRTTREQYEKKQGEYDEEKESLIESRKDLTHATREKDRMAEECEAAELELKRVDLKLRNLERDCEQSITLKEQYDSKYAWIDMEKDSFGVAGGEYDFQGQRVEDARKELDALKETQETLESKINKKAMAMFENAESEYQDLMNKKRIVEKDRAKIESVITELDDKKNDTLKATWKKVNRSFGEIFSSLLPGTNAKLEPPEGGTLEDGLEIRVALGNVWKDSLSELSGGQRSLIALSLILAMLRFKPAPMYILDEVDAALDLSHTQNIGRMLRKHFRGSQFIVVSLKEGMFQNANIIFRTKFIDGVSTISRSTNRVSSNSDSEDEDSEAGALARPRKSRGILGNDGNKENVENNTPRLSRKRRLQ